MISRLREKFGTFVRALHREADGDVLAVFRIFWGIALFLTAWTGFDQVTGFYSPDFYHFRYFGFEWVPIPESESVTVIELTSLLIFSVAIIAGLFSGISLIGYALIYLHLFLIDAVYFNNHYYLTILVCCLLAACKPDNAFSLRSLLLRRSPPRSVLIWNYWILRTQIIIVYFYGGLSKINPDWLRGEPVRQWFNQHTGIKWPMQTIAKEEWFVWLTAYSGILVDLILPFFLLYKRTRIPAAVIFIVFHAINSRLFTIGWFPLIGIILLIPFFEPGSFIKKTDGKYDTQTKVGRAHLTAIILTAYVFFQILIPLRPYLFATNPSWSEVGHEFSWRMMLRNKDSYLDIIIKSPVAREWAEQHPAKMPRMLAKQSIYIQERPWLLLQFVREIDRILAENGFPDVPIHVVSIVALNDHSYQFLIDPSVDLTQAEYSPIRTAPWILPFQKILPKRNLPETDDERMASLLFALKLFREQYPELKASIEGYEDVVRSLRK